MLYKQISGITQARVPMTRCMNAAKSRLTGPGSPVRARSLRLHRFPFAGLYEQSGRLLEGGFRHDCSELWLCSSIKLVAPSSATTVAVNFKGIAGSGQARRSILRKAVGASALSRFFPTAPANAAPRGLWNYKATNPDEVHSISVFRVIRKLWLVVSSRRRNIITTGTARDGETGER